MKMRFILGDEGRKGLVKAISSILGVKSKYMGAPGFCYDVGGALLTGMVGLIFQTKLMRVLLQKS